MLSARIGLRIATATLVAVVVLVAYAVAGGSSGYTFATGTGFNLRIDSRAFYNGNPVPSSTWNLKNLTPGSDKFFNIDDVKPGDWGRAVISFHVNKNAWMCLEFKNFQDKENGENEPESAEDSTNGGDLGDGMEFFSWHDDGDTIYEPGEKVIFGLGAQAATQVIKGKKYALAEYGNGTQFAASNTRYVGISWCAGNLTVSTSTGNVTCDGEALGNEAQTDSLSVDLSMTAVPVSEQPKFKCGGGKGLGEEIGLFVKCEALQSYGWPIPTYSTECPGGFGSNDSSSSSSGGGRTPRSR